MKKIAVLLLFLPIFFPGIGQKHKMAKAEYKQKLEYGLEGPLKEVTTYICNWANDTIPADTADYSGKTTMTFDRSGNPVAINKIWDFGKMGKSEYRCNFSGKGKELSLQEISRIDSGNFETTHYEYVWSDEYNYTMIAPEHNIYSMVITLDENYRLIKTVTKKEGTVQSTEDWKTIYKNGKIQEIETRITETRDGAMEVSYQIQVVQRYDKYGNPTVLYGYNDRNKQRVKHVLYKEYKYYEP